MTSKYQKIVTSIRQGIEDGRYKRGEKLPSIRKLSQDFHCSKDTVQKAMLELKYQHLIYAVEKSGYYILEDKAFQETTASLNPADFARLPYEDFRTCLTESLVGRENYLFNYYHQQAGLDELITSMVKLLADYFVYCKKEDIVITAGSQQALYILTQMNFPDGRTDILLERPTYHRMERLVEELDLPYQTIERSLSGIDFDQLETIFQTGTIKFFYTIPRLHNPLGTSYTLEEKKKLVQLANKYQVYLVEDDYLADFDTATPPLHYLDMTGQVIYIKSFTPTLFPALRIGSLVLPKQLKADFLQHKSLIDYDTNLIMQKALSLYIDNGMFARNTHGLTELASQQSRHIQSILDKFPISLPHQINRNKLVIQLTLRELTPALKQLLQPADMLQIEDKIYLTLTDSNVIEQVCQILSVETRGLEDDCIQSIRFSVGVTNKLDCG